MKSSTKGEKQETTPTANSSATEAQNKQSSTATAETEVTHKQKPVTKKKLNYGWTVTFAGIGINLALGILYTWSVISKAIPKDWGWSETDKSWPYSIACLVFCLIMVPAGHLQDKFSPRLTATIGGILVGLGMIIASQTTSAMGYIIGFGILAGAGIGFGYASATPPAVKWFPAAKTGLIAGLVVSGFGLASVYAAPLCKHLIATQGLQNTMLFLGIGFLIIVVGFAQLLRPPHKVQQLMGKLGPKHTFTKPTANEFDPDNYTPGEMLKTPQFYILWFLYACGAGAGLMIISKLAKIADLQAGIKLGFWLVVALAIGNGVGRIVAGIASDKIGRRQTMFICFVMQAILIFLLSQTSKDSFLATPAVIAIISALIGANYGANLALFPSVTKDFYGLKNFGVNYGLVFTAWGVGGFMLAMLAGKLYDKYQSFSIPYYTASGLLLAAAILSFIAKSPKAKKAL